MGTGRGRAGPLQRDVGPQLLRGEKATLSLGSTTRMMVTDLKTNRVIFCFGFEFNESFLINKRTSQWALTSEGVSCSEGRLARNCCGDSRPPTPSEGKPGRLFRGLMRPPRLAAAAAAAAGGSGKSGCGCGVGKPLPPMRSPAGMCECRCPPTRGTLKEPPMNPSPPYC